jgi:branched-chain amino acid aminotransferase
MLATATASLTRRTPGLLRCFSSVPSFKAADLTVTTTTAPKEKPDPETLKFGEKFSDHMLEIDWTEEEGWGKPTISQYKNLSLSPAITGLHYGIQCFEGMKCYHNAGDDSLKLFRPDKNMARLNSSMNRLAMPQFDSNEMIELLKKFCEVEKDWVPKGQGYSLYLRPTAIGTQPFLGVDVSRSVKLFVIASPVGPYYRTGFNPVSLYADKENKRAWPGGVGSFKVGGNYGPTIAPAKEAMEKGYNQILWMWGDDDEVTECGAMNLFFVIKNEEGKKELWTGPLTRGDILPGVTRDSILSLARTSWDDVTVREEFPNMKQIRKASEEGRLLESFGAGTAAVVAPINRIFYDGKDIEIPATGEITQRIWDSLNAIYYGESEGPEGWSVKV